MSMHLQVTRREAVGIIELARPEKFNAISRAAVTGIGEALDAFSRPDSGVRAILVQAQGKNFCTGADLDESGALCADRPALDAFIAFVHNTLGRLEASPLPVVAACQGMALAGGLEILLACDVVFAADTASFGDQHVHYGLIPAWGASQRLARQVGLKRSLDLMYSGRRIDAPTALRWGLVNYVVPAAELPDAALGYCATLATRSRPGLAMMKQLARRGLEGSLEAGLALERQGVSQTMTGPDAAEGLAAFHARRPPEFKA